MMFRFCAPYLYTVFIALFFSYCLVNIVAYSILKPLPYKATEAVEVPTVSIVELDYLISRNIFDIDLRTDLYDSKQRNIVTDRPTDLNIKLTGIIEASKASSSKAIILSGEEILILEPTVENQGYTLIEASGDKAVIEFKGGTHTLKIEDSANRGDINFIKTEAAGSASSNITSNNKVVIKREKLLSELSDLNKLLKSLLIVPYEVNGKLEGYRITRMNRNSPVLLLGLRLGDVINRVNGEELETPEPLFAMLKQVNSVRAIAIDITRGGKKQTIFIDIQ